MTGNTDKLNNEVPRLPSYTIITCSCGGKMTVGDVEGRLGVTTEVYLSFKGGRFLRQASRFYLCR
jgi:hypothetical protein